MTEKRSVEYWKYKAEEARVFAETMNSETNKQIMLGIAADFERMARLALEGEALTERITAQKTSYLRTVSEMANVLTKR
jgi:hypothetical protein